MFFSFINFFYFLISSFFLLKSLFFSSVDVFPILCFYLSVLFFSILFNTVLFFFLVFYLRPFFSVSFLSFIYFIHYHSLHVYTYTPISYTKIAPSSSPTVHNCPVLVNAVSTRPYECVENSWIGTDSWDLLTDSRTSCKPNKIRRSKVWKIERKEWSRKQTKNERIKKDGKENKKNKKYDKNQEKWRTLKKEVEITPRYDLIWSDLI